MNSSLKMRLALGILSIGSWQSYAFGRSAEETKPLRLCVHLYHPADVSRRDLNNAAKEAARILAGAGVEITCQLGLADAPEANISDQHAAGRQRQEADLRNYLVVKILSGFPDGWLRTAWRPSSIALADSRSWLPRIPVRRAVLNG